VVFGHFWHGRASRIYKILKKWPKTTWVLIWHHSQKSVRTLPMASVFSCFRLVGHFHQKHNQTIIERVFTSPPIPNFANVNASLAAACVVEFPHAIFTPQPTRTTKNGKPNQNPFVNFVILEQWPIGPLV